MGHTAREGYAPLYSYSARLLVEASDTKYLRRDPEPKRPAHENGVAAARRCGKPWPVHGTRLVRLVLGVGEEVFLVVVVGAVR